MSREFELLGIDEDYAPFFIELGITSPNSMQKKVIKSFMSGNSVVCLSQTGSGKTLAYALPSTEQMKAREDVEGVSSKEGRPKIIVVAPTKELATQIEKVFKSISHHVAFRTRSLLGGQKKSLKSAAFEVLVITPQRLASSLKSKEIHSNELQHLIFDEFDNLFEMGFRREIEQALNFIDFEQTKVHFFSATLSLKAKEYIEEKFQKLRPEWFNFESNKLLQKLSVYNIYLSPNEKKQMLKAFFEKKISGRGIVFVNQKNQIIELQNFLEESKVNIKYKVIHGDMSQKERMSAHRSFTTGKAQVLIASDIMARGIDIDDLTWVLNFGLPKDPTYYLHRCGRVGRGGREGSIYNFISHFDSKLIGHINEAIKSQSTLDLELIKTSVRKAQSTPKQGNKKGTQKKTSTRGGRSSTRRGANSQDTRRGGQKKVSKRTSRKVTKRTKMYEQGKKSYTKKR